MLDVTSNPPVIATISDSIIIKNLIEVARLNAQLTPIVPPVAPTCGAIINLSYYNMVPKERTKRVQPYLTSTRPGYLIDFRI